jgi:hypothetical protein
VGAAIGSALHFLALPVLRLVRAYMKLGEVALLVCVGMLTPEDASRYRQNILNEHFSQPRPDDAADQRAKESDARVELTGVGHSPKQKKRSQGESEK